MTDVIKTPEGEEICYGDLLVGIDVLSPRQREAFQLICLEGHTEATAAKIMLPDSKWPTTVQQHVNAALERMVARYDEQQSGVRQLIRRVRIFMALHPIVERHLNEGLKAAKKELQSQIEGIKQVIAQVDQMASGDVAPKVAKEPGGDS